MSVFECFIYRLSLSEHQIARIQMNSVFSNLLVQMCLRRRLCCCLLRSYHKLSRLPLPTSLLLPRLQTSCSHVHRHGPDSVDPHTHQRLRRAPNVHLLLGKAIDL